MSAARTAVQLEFGVSAEARQEEESVQSDSTFSLPDLQQFPQDFRKFLEKDLIEISALTSLERSGRLNW